MWCYDAYFITKYVIMNLVTNQAENIWLWGHLTESVRPDSRGWRGESQDNLNGEAEEMLLFLAEFTTNDSEVDIKF